jgi:hypothetical protein
MLGSILRRQPVLSDGGDKTRENMSLDLSILVERLEVLSRDLPKVLVNIRCILA